MKIKKTTLVITLASISTYFMLTGYNLGPGANGWDCTGAETGLGNPSGCTTGNCHGTAATTGIAVTIELDSVGIPTTHYVGGMTYTVKITGTNNTNSTLPRFGLQMGSIRGSAAVTTPTNAGTWNSPFPTGTHFSAPQAGLFVVGVVEQSTSQAATTGTGGNGSTYVRVFNWKAPNAGTGTISFWAALNAVNNNNSADSGDKWNKTHVVINEWPITTGIASAATSKNEITVFPNPASDHVTVNYDALPVSSNAQIRIMDISGKTVNVIPVDNSSTRTDVNCSDFANGIYFFSLITNDGVAATQKVVVAK